jgi:hypothetical protein
LLSTSTPYWPASCPGRSTTEERKSPTYLLDRLDGPKSRSGRRGEEKIFYPTGIGIVQSVASRYTDCAIPAPYVELLQLISTQVNQSILFGTSRLRVSNETLSLSFRKLIVGILFSVISCTRVAERIPQQRPSMALMCSHVTQGLPKAQPDFRWNSSELT